MHKVIVIGCSGAGKSTFARRLRDETGLPLYHLDLIWHKADRTTISREEFDDALERIMQTEAWIIDGNYGRTMERRIAMCDTVFFLDMPTEVCLAGAEARVGKKRDDMPWIEESFDESFREWILSFSEQHLPQIRDLLLRYADKRIIVFHSWDEINAFDFQEII